MRYVLLDSVELATLVWSHELLNSMTNAEETTLLVIGSMVLARYSIVTW